VELEPSLLRRLYLGRDPVLLLQEVAYHRKRITKMLLTQIFFCLSSFRGG
jgi:hypothetical protein